MFTELKNRGVQDVLIAVCDSLKGFPEAINRWGQQCIVHLIRNSFRYGGRQHCDGIVRSLKPVYTTPSEAAAIKPVSGLDPNGGGRTRWVMRWKPTPNAYPITFAGRFERTTH